MLSSLNPKAIVIRPTLLRVQTPGTCSLIIPIGYLTNDLISILTQIA